MLVVTPLYYAVICQDSLRKTTIYQNCWSTGSSDYKARLTPMFCESSLKYNDVSTVVISELNYTFPLC